MNGLNPDHLKQVDKGCSIDLSEYLEAFPANCLVDADSLNISVLRKEYDLYIRPFIIMGCSSMVMLMKGICLIIIIVLLFYFI